MKLKTIAFAAAFVSILGWSASAGAEELVYSKAVKSVEIFRTSTTAAGQPMVYPKADQPEVTMLRVTIPPGQETGWHKHPYPGYAYALAGRLVVETEDGKANEFGPGQGFAEVVNLLHNGKNNGAETVELVAVFTGEKGKAFTVKP